MMFGHLRDAKMVRFLVHFWCWAVLHAVLAAGSRNSRFGRFNSRLGANKFPFMLRRELPSNPLIWHANLGPWSGVNRENRKNSRLHGNNREFAPAMAGVRS
jgi:hypothetical protein